MNIKLEYILILLIAILLLIILVKKTNCCQRICNNGFRVGGQSDCQSYFNNLAINCSGIGQDDNPNPRCCNGSNNTNGLNMLSQECINTLIGDEINTIQNKVNYCKDIKVLSFINSRHTFFTDKDDNIPDVYRPIIQTLDDLSNKTGKPVTYEIIRGLPIDKFNRFGDYITAYTDKINNNKVEINVNFNKNDNFIVGGQWTPELLTPLNIFTRFVMVLATPVAGYYAIKYCRKTIETPGSIMLAEDKDNPLNRSDFQLCDAFVGMFMLGMKISYDTFMEKISPIIDIGDEGEISYVRPIISELTNEQLTEIGEQMAESIDDLEDLQEVQNTLRIPNPEFLPEIQDNYGASNPEGQFTVNPDDDLRDVGDIPEDFPPRFTVDPDDTLTDAEMGELTNAFPDDFPPPEPAPYTPPVSLHEHNVINPNEIDPKTGRPLDPEGGLEDPEDFLEDIVDNPEALLEDLIGK